MGRRLVLVVVMLWVRGLSYGQSAPASSPAALPQDPGYATGHVTCGNTQRPARMAKVRFVPVPAGTIALTEQSAPKSRMSGLETSQLFGSEINPVETDMDGNFTARNLRPGRYVVRVDLGGYLTPLLSFSATDFQHPDEAARQRVMKELTIVDIGPHAETRVDVTLQRGASISGTVRFDDGTSAIEIGLDLMVKNAKGEWESTNLLGYRFGTSDSQGHYWVDAVPPGEYLMRANLSLNEYSNSVMPMNGNEVHVQMTKTIFSLSVYTGSVLRTREATPIKVEGAASCDGNDISLPISKLHRVSGAVMADGHPLNAGRLVLRFADDHSEVASVGVSRDDRQFHFPYVPEGSYTLAVEEAREVTEVEVPNAPGVTPKTHMEERTVRSYGKVEQPLVVQSDLQGVLATVPEPSKASAPAAAAQMTP